MSAKNEAGKLNMKQKKFLKLYEANLCNISKTCRSLKMSRRTFHNWKKDNELFAEAIAEIDESSLDDGEFNLKLMMRGIPKIEDNKFKGWTVEPNTTALIFFLKTKGKARGYVEKQEIQHEGTIEVGLPDQLKGM